MATKYPRRRLHRPLQLAHRFSLLLKKKRLNLAWKTHLMSPFLSTNIYRMYTSQMSLLNASRRRPIAKTSVQYCTESLIYSCRSEEHTSELQSRLHLVCRLLLEKKKTKI